MNSTSCFLFFMLDTPIYLKLYGGSLVSVYVSVMPTSWQVDKSEDVVLDEAGETQEDRVEEETHEP